ncbi:hypothetical protein P3X46_023637 [Hevea brasiliensis]|uniref:PGG domain-containing protein n=1 Tax=Hevea brasiliensis TaxID=3981 RepID=A0ABQ9LDF3_HEVBR|nr:ankyrin repeat-containing protein NPR4 [Hevea brasiliensis]KAJ9164019.1 hypothetical protein P3X46_023637 [Hevea brasiliensis]
MDSRIFSPGDDGGAIEYHELLNIERAACNGNANEFQHEDSQGQEHWGRVSASSCIQWSEAAREGRVSSMRELLIRYPESVMDVTPMTRETPLHLAVRHGHCDVVRWLVETLRRTTCYRDVINRKDCGGDTVLHLATCRKQLPTLKLMLEDSPTHSGMVEVNAKNNGGFTALDILEAIPENEEVDVAIKEILVRAGASRGRDIADSSNHEVYIEVGKQWQRLFPKQATRSEFLISKYHGLLITSTLLATLTFHAALRPPTVMSEVFHNESSRTFPLEKQDAEINHLFILFNSIAFFTSMALITLLTHELPLMPWLLISVTSTIGAYMCSIMAVSPHEVVTVFFIGSCILLAAFLKCLALDKMVLDFMQWICSRIELT